MKKIVRLHIRRCHLCAGVTENESAPVDRCTHCGKSMAPFYFFDDVSVSPLSDVDVRSTELCHAGQRVPVRGFTAYW